MLPLKSKLFQVLLFATLAYLASLTEVSLGPLESLAAPVSKKAWSRPKAPTRNLGRSSGSRTSPATARFSRVSSSNQQTNRPTQQHTSSTQQTNRTPRQQHSPSTQQTNRAPQQQHTPSTQQTTGGAQQQHTPSTQQTPGGPQQQHPPSQAQPATPPQPPAYPAYPNNSYANPVAYQGGAPQPPPPAHAYPTTHANQQFQGPPVSQPVAPAPGGFPVHQVPPPSGHPPAQAAAAPVVSSGPSLMQTAVTSAVGSAVGSMVGTAVVNSFSRKSEGSSDSSDTSSSTKAPSTVAAAAPDTSTASNTTTSAPVDPTQPNSQPQTTTSTTQNSRPPLDGVAGVRLSFPGLGEAELRNSLKSAESFGAAVQEAVTRSVGVSSGRVVLREVSFSQGSSGGEKPGAVVTLSLLPDEDLRPTEPSAQELADEISRQVSQGTSYLTRQLRMALPQLAEEFLQPGVVKAVVLGGSNPDAKSTNSGRLPVSSALLISFVASIIMSF